MAPSTRRTLHPIVIFVSGDRECVVRVTLGSDSQEARGRTPKGAKEAAAKAMLQQIGPYIEDSVYKSHLDNILASVPQNCASWLSNPIFDSRHVSMINKDGGPLKVSLIF